MRLKVLGAYGASDASHNLTGYLIDDRIAVDAGTLTSKLTYAQQARIECVFITHAHADHIRDLPHLIHNRFSQNAPPLIVVAARDVMEQLRSHVFNDVVWPDFGRFISPETGKPAIEYRALQPGRRWQHNDFALTAHRVDHLVPASGVLVETSEQSIAFTGDTGPTRDFWKKIGSASGLVAVISEASFPNEQKQLAIDSGHLTPEMFGDEIRKLDADVPVYASHRKIPFERSIESEIRNIRDRRARILVEKQYTF